MRFSFSGTAAVLALSCVGWALPTIASAGQYSIVIGETETSVTGSPQKTMTLNGQSPGPTLRLKEGEMAEIAVTNTLKEDSSIHWHGLILPYQQDGVPGFSFQGIKPGETVTYRFPVVQSGTYWYHSHSGLQEQAGMLAPIVIEPKDPDPIKADREAVVMLSDFHPDAPNDILANLKKDSGYYNVAARRTTGTLIDDAGKNGLAATVRDRLEWGAMRMAPTDISDISGYTFLINGQPPGQPWRSLFKPGETVRLRFINGAAMTYFDVRIPGLKLTVVAADGNPVKPVAVDEFRMAVGETYDVLVTPTEDQPYTIFAEPLDRSGYARGTLTPRDGEDGPVPPVRPRPLLTMTDMGMDHGSMGDDMKDMAGMDHSAMGHDMKDMASMDHSAMGHDMKGMAGMDHGAMGHDMKGMVGMDHSAMGHDMKDMAGMDHSAMGHDMKDMAGMDHSAMGHDMKGMAGMDHSAMGHDMKGMAGMDHSAMQPPSSPPPAAPGTVSADFKASSGLAPSAANGGRMLQYADLLPLTPRPQTAPDRAMTFRLGGNMERYFWTIDGEKFSTAAPIRMTQGERIRVTLVNETMMNHPIHLHGMWFQVVRSDGQDGPLKHVLNVPPGQSVTLDILADALGQWPFHCHFMYHMATGMMRRVIVDPPASSGQPATPDPMAFPGDHNSHSQHSGGSHG